MGTKDNFGAKTLQTIIAATHKKERNGTRHDNEFTPCITVLAPKVGTVGAPRSFVSQSGYTLHALSGGSKANATTLKLGSKMAVACTSRL